MTEYLSLFLLLYVFLVPDLTKSASIATPICSPLPPLTDAATAAVVVGTRFVLTCNTSTSEERIYECVYHGDGDETAWMEKVRGDDVEMERIVFPSSFDYLEDECPEMKVSVAVIRTTRTHRHLCQAPRPELLRERNIDHVIPALWKFPTASLKLKCAKGYGVPTKVTTTRYVHLNCVEVGGTVRWRITNTCKRWCTTPSADALLTAPRKDDRKTRYIDRGVMIFIPSRSYRVHCIGGGKFQRLTVPCLRSFWETEPRQLAKWCSVGTPKKNEVHVPVCAPLNTKGLVLTFAYPLNSTLRYSCGGKSTKLLRCAEDSDGRAEWLSEAGGSADDEEGPCTFQDDLDNSITKRSVREATTSEPVTTITSTTPKPAAEPITTTQKTPAVTNATAIATTEPIPTTQKPEVVASAPAEPVTNASASPEAITTTQKQVVVTNATSAPSEPITTTQKPAVTAEPITTTQKPAVTNATSIATPEPITTTQKPAVVTNDPAEPIPTSQKPAAVVTNATSAPAEPITTTQKPSVTTQKPALVANATTEPIPPVVVTNATSAPAEPITTTQKPATTQKPIVTTEPITTTQKPAITAEPTTTTLKPATTQKPIVTTEPITTTQKPDVTTQKPAVVTNAPAEPIPTTVTSDPAEPVTNASASPEAPEAITTTQKQVVVTNATSAPAEPITTTQKPPAVTNATAIATTEPITTTQKPAVVTNAPAEPITTTQKPAVTAEPITTTTQKPIVTTVPIPTTQKPAAVVTNATSAPAEPITTTQKPPAPIPTTQKPAVTTQKPAVTNATAIASTEPITTTQKPPAVTNATAIATTEAIPTTQKPAAVTNATSAPAEPITTTQKPAVVTNATTEPTQKPAVTNATAIAKTEPITTTQKPAAVTNATSAPAEPITTTQKPALVTNATTEPTQKPAVTNATAIATTKPITTTQKPPAVTNASAIATTEAITTTQKQAAVTNASAPAEPITTTQKPAVTNATAIAIPTTHKPTAAASGTTEPITGSFVVTNAIASTEPITRTSNASAPVEPITTMQKRAVTNASTTTEKPATTKAEPITTTQKPAVVTDASAPAEATTTTQKPAVTAYDYDDDDTIYWKFKEKGSYPVFELTLMLLHTQLLYTKSVFIEDEYADNGATMFYRCNRGYGLVGKKGGGGKEEFEMRCVWGTWTGMQKCERIQDYGNESAPCETGDVFFEHKAGQISSNAMFEEEYSKSRLVGHGESVIMRCKKGYAASSAIDDTAFLIHCENGTWTSRSVDNAAVCRLQSICGHLPKYLVELYNLDASKITYLEDVANASCATENDIHVEFICNRSNGQWVPKYKLRWSCMMSEESEEEEYSDSCGMFPLPSKMPMSLSYGTIVIYSCGEITTETATCVYVPLESPGGEWVDIETGLPIIIGPNCMVTGRVLSVIEVNDTEVTTEYYGIDTTKTTTTTTTTKNHRPPKASAPPSTKWVTSPPPPPPPLSNKTTPKPRDVTTAQSVSTTTTTMGVTSPLYNKSTPKPMDVTPQFTLKLISSATQAISTQTALPSTASPSPSSPSSNANSWLDKKRICFLVVAMLLSLGHVSHRLLIKV